MEPLTPMTPAELQAQYAASGLPPLPVAEPVEPEQDEVAKFGKFDGLITMVHVEGREPIWVDVDGINIDDGTQTRTTIPYPTELIPLTGLVTLTEDGYWLVPRCEKCGQFKNTCCGRTLSVTALRNDKTLTSFGRQALGLEPIKIPKPPKTDTEIAQFVLDNLVRVHSINGRGVTLAASSTVVDKARGILL